MKSILHTSDSRGRAQFGWLDSRHSFSFGRYFNPEKMGFGLLRVLNDDQVAGGAGFPTHPHDNMEIISIPLRGAIEHQDSTGTRGVIKTGDVQIMSAGSGITHSEYNHSADEQLNFLQIWIMPDKKNIQPRYDQKTFHPEEHPNQWITVVAPDDENALWINQDAYLHLIKTDKPLDTGLRTHRKHHGFYLFVIEGMVETAAYSLGRRDAAGFYEAEQLSMKLSENAYVLAIEIPAQQPN
jgi:hypothetical protein